VRACVCVCARVCLCVRVCVCACVRVISYKTVPDRSPYHFSARPLVDFLF